MYVNVSELFEVTERRKELEKSKTEARIIQCECTSLNILKPKMVLPGRGPHSAEVAFELYTQRPRV